MLMEQEVQVLQQLILLAGAERTIILQQPIHTLALHTRALVLVRFIFMVLHLIMHMPFCLSWIPLQYSGTTCRCHSKAISQAQHPHTAALMLV